MKSPGLIEHSPKGLPQDRDAPLAYDEREGIRISNGRLDWYVVQVKRFSEGRVLHHLSMKSIPTFLPLVESVRRSNSRLRLTRLEPLFPGYLFVRMDPLETNPEAWHAVRWNPGVQRILGTGGTPLAVPELAVEAIQAMTKDLGFVRPGSRFTAGARVRIRYGPLAGLEAVFDRPMSKSGRVRVLLEFLGQVQRIEVEELDLELA